MSRPKGSKNKKSAPYPMGMTDEERVMILADAILDAIELEIKDGTLPEIEEQPAQSEIGSSSTPSSSFSSA